MYIKWIGHSCFKIIGKNQSIVIDPYATKSVLGYKDINETANEVYCSHEHSDHNYVAAVKINKVIDREFTVSKINCFHDECNGNKRGLNTIHIIEHKGTRIAHLGDLGHMLSDADIYKLKEIDCLLIPIGGYYTIDAETAYQIITKIKPKIIVPMHYRNDNCGYEVLDTIDNFLSHFKKEEIFIPKCNTMKVDEILYGKVVVLNHQ